MRVFLTIGAIKFSRNGDLPEMSKLHTFYRRITIDSCKAEGLHVDPRNNVCGGLDKIKTQNTKQWKIQNGYRCVKHLLSLVNGLEILNIQRFGQIRLILM